MGHKTPTSRGGAAYECLERELGVLLRRARAVSTAMASTVHPELDAAAYGLLVRIDEIGSARITDLAEYFRVGKPTVSRQVALLEALGLIGRADGDGDQRNRHLSLTPDGRSRLSHARAGRREIIRSQLRAWSTDDVASLADLLRRFNGDA